MTEHSLGTSAGRTAVAPHSWSTTLAAMAVMLGYGGALGAEKTAIADKTLVAWVAPANLSQRGGSVLTLEKSGGVFDAIVFGEIAEAKLMAGSNGFVRTKREQETFPAETADSKSLVQIAVVYQGPQITIYRNGGKYAEYTTKGAEQFGGERDRKAHV